MAAEVVELLGPVPTGLVVDATVGGGGHARAILDARPDLHLLGIDRDPVAVAAAGAALEPFGERVRIVQGGFEDVADIVGSTDIAGKRGNRGDPVRPGRQQPAARPSGAGLLVLGRRRAARHAHGQRADADRGDGRERLLRGRPRRADRPQR